MDTVISDKDNKVVEIHRKQNSKHKFNWKDPLHLDELLSEEEKLIRDTAFDYAQKKLMPRVEEAFLEEKTDKKIFSEMGQLGLLGITIPEKYGCAGASYVSYGLVAREVERIDSGYRSMMSVQSSLVMHPINAFGNEEQKTKFLPKLASGDYIGCFGLTEPDAGSDPGAMKTVAKKVSGGYEVTGTKMWISNSPIADIFIVWAKSSEHDNQIKGFILEKGMKGLSAPKINKKLSLRSSITGEIVMEQVFVPQENLLPNVSGLKGPFSCLNRARYGISWGVMGAAEDCWFRAREYTLDRKQFGRPIAEFQGLQWMMADMSIGLEASRALLHNAAKGAGNSFPDMEAAAKAKVLASETAIKVTNDALQIHGSMGYSRCLDLERHVRDARMFTIAGGTAQILRTQIASKILGIRIPQKRDGYLRHNS